MPLLLCAIAGVLVMHQSLGSSSVDSLKAIGIMDPKLGSQLLLLVLFYNNILTREDVICRDMSVSVLCCTVGSCPFYPTLHIVGFYLFFWLFIISICNSTVL